MQRLKPSIRTALASRWLPWTIITLILAAALLYELLLLTQLTTLSRLAQAAIWLVAFSGLVVAYLTITRYLGLVDQREQLTAQLAEAERQVADAYQRLEAIFRVSQKFVEASDENEILEPVLRLLVELTGAQGASFVPLDEHGQPQTALSHGVLPFPVMEAWVEYLASPGVRERCGNCENREPSERPNNCPLLKGPFATAAGLVCLSVRRGEREFGVLTLFLKDSATLDEHKRIYLRALMEEVALGLDGVYLRRKELSTLRQMQVLRKKTDLTVLLSGLLDHMHHSLEADFARLDAPGAGESQSRLTLNAGDFPAQAQPFVDGIVQAVVASGEPVLLGEVAGDAASGMAGQPGVKSLVAAPLLTSTGGVLGAILVGNRRNRSFHQRHLALLQTVAGQVALVVQNANLMAELEYQTMIQERARLAREIHDGLAQTIGFLKLQTAQLRNYLARGDTERVQQTVDMFYVTISEAYKDARQAIDGLRIAPDECGLAGWLEQMLAEFEEISGLQVELQITEGDFSLSPEIHAQLIRILQEALSNVRKHALASQVWVVCRESRDDLVLEVRDDGDGFAPEDVVAASRHGLRGMRERADLIGADFQVISRPHEGTIVRLRLPAKRPAPKNPMEMNLP